MISPLLTLFVCAAAFNAKHDDLIDINDVTLLDENFPGAAASTASGSKSMNEHHDDDNDLPIASAHSSNEDRSYIKKFERHFGFRFDRNILKLVQKAEVAKVPWPSPEWPSYEDGINKRWGNESMSAVEKYCKAYGFNAEKIASSISQRNGIDASNDRQSCTSDAQCIDLKDTKCAIRRNHKSGFCIPEWFGICHSWSPAAILEEEPRCNVISNNVLFTPMDIKALMSQVYARTHTPTIFTGQRCEEESPAKDQYGRYIESACRDITPAYFHLAITNIVGKLRTSIVVDRTATSEVWNQPVRSYQILEQSLISYETASDLFSPGSVGTYPNNFAASLYKVKMKFDYIIDNDKNVHITSNPKLLDESTESKYYEYILEVDSYNAVIGGEWIRDSKADHVDFIWMAMRKPMKHSPLSVFEGLQYRRIAKLLKDSVEGSCLY